MQSSKDVLGADINDVSTPSYAQVDKSRKATVSGEELLPVSLPVYAEVRKQRDQSNGQNAESAVNDMGSDHSTPSYAQVEKNMNNC